MKLSTLAVLTALAMNSIAHADTPRFSPIRDTRSLFVPVGFDDNDDVVVVLDGYIGDPCDKLRAPKVIIDKANGSITITPMKERVGENCPEILVPYQQVVNLGTLPMGTYAVQTFDDKLGEILSVKKAPFATPDDHLYAPVDSAHVSVQVSGTMTATVRGRLTDSCLSIEKVEVLPSGRTMVVLPIMKKSATDPQGAACQPIERPFESRVELPVLTAGRYLLHVRSLNGQSVNEVFSVL